MNYQGSALMWIQYQILQHVDLLWSQNSSQVNDCADFDQVNFYNSNFFSYVIDSNPNRSQRDEVLLLQNVT